MTYAFNCRGRGTSIVKAFNDFVWGPPMPGLILGTGLFLQLRSR